MGLIYININNNNNFISIFILIINSNNKYFRIFIFFLNCSFKKFFSLFLLILILVPWSNWVPIEGLSEGQFF